jgi:hypothetical protein
MHRYLAEGSRQGRRGQKFLERHLERSHRSSPRPERSCRLQLLFYYVAVRAATCDAEVCVGDANASNVSATVHFSTLPIELAPFLHRRRGISLALRARHP